MLLDHILPNPSAGWIVYVLLAIFVGAYVRGLTGFASSMLWVTSLSLALPPAAVVPMVLIFEVAASSGLLPAVWRDVDWKSMGWLLGGMALATPVGIYGLATLPADTTRIVIAVTVLAAVVLISLGYSRTRPPGRPLSVGVGALSGVLNGTTGAGGMPVILFYFVHGMRTHVSRASIIVYIMATDILGTGVMAGHGLITSDVLLRTALALPVIGLGILAGHASFRRISADAVRRVALVCLAGLAAGLIVRSL